MHLRISDLTDSRASLRRRRGNWLAKKEPRAEHSRHQGRDLFRHYVAAMLLAGVVAACSGSSTRVEEGEAAPPYSDVIAVYLAREVARHAHGADGENTFCVHEQAATEPAGQNRVDVFLAVHCRDYNLVDDHLEAANGGAYWAVVTVEETAAGWVALANYTAGDGDDDARLPGRIRPALRKAGQALDGTTGLLDAAAVRSTDRALHSRGGEGYYEDPVPREPYRLVTSGRMASFRWTLSSADEGRDSYGNQRRCLRLSVDGGDQFRTADEVCDVMPFAAFQKVQKLSQGTVAAGGVQWVYGFASEESGKVEGVLADGGSERWAVRGQAWIGWLPNSATLRGLWLRRDNHRIGGCDVPGGGTCLS